MITPSAKNYPVCAWRDCTQIQYHKFNPILVSAIYIYSLSLVRDRGEQHHHERVIMIYIYIVNNYVPGGGHSSTAAAPLVGTRRSTPCDHAGGHCSRPTATGELRTVPIANILTPGRARAFFIIGGPIERGNPDKRVHGARFLKDRVQWHNSTGPYGMKPMSQTLHCNTRKASVLGRLS